MSKRRKTSKLAKPEQSEIAPLPTTSGLANAERRDQLPPAEKDKKQAPQLTAEQRNALFEDFLKWNMDKGIFGRP